MYRKLSLLLLVFTLVIGSSAACFATECCFTNVMRFVDSNEWTYIVGANKVTESDTASVKITNIYDANRNTSSYTTVKAKATVYGTSVQVKKGKYYEVPIPDSFQAAGKFVGLYCKGNNPSLDCYVKGYWEVH